MNWREHRNRAYEDQRLVRITVGEWRTEQLRAFTMGAVVSGILVALGILGMFEYVCKGGAL